MAVKSNLFLDFFNKAYFAQSLKLIEAKYKLDLLEQKIIEQIILKMESNDEKFVKFENHNLLQICGLEEIKGQQKIKDACRRLLSRVLSLKDKNNETRQTHWVQSIVYQEKHIIIELNCYLKPFLLQLKSILIYLNSKELMKMKSQYSGGIYIFLKYYYEINRANKIRFTLTELIELLGCSYKKYFDFRVNVLDMLERDINKNTDMQIRYFPEKIGRKVEYINFEFSIN